jgi:ABC-type taurine transport system substrate-binding protein
MANLPTWIRKNPEQIYDFLKSIILLDLNYHETAQVWEQQAESAGLLRQRPRAV